MKYRVHVGRLPSGEYQANCLDPHVTARGVSVDEALEKIRGEIRYFAELCPCTAVSETFVELELVSQPPRSGGKS